MVWCPVSTTPVPQKFVAFAAVTSASRDASGRTATLFFLNAIAQFAPTKQTGSHWRRWLCPCSVSVCRRRSRETVEQLGSCLFWMLWFWFSIDRERPDVRLSSCILCFNYSSPVIRSVPSCILSAKPGETGSRSVG